HRDIMCFPYQLHRRIHSLLHFLLHAVLRHRHSFPTRRSSDLSAVRADDPPKTTETRLPPPAEVKELQAYPKQARLVGGRRKARLDRKSTRLNSSHRTISYAVFCLKKKNIVYV